MILPHMQMKDHISGYFSICHDSHVWQDADLNDTCFQILILWLEGSAVKCKSKASIRWLQKQSLKEKAVTAEGFSIWEGVMHQRVHHKDEAYLNT